MTEIKLASGIAFLALLMLEVACGAPMQEGDATGTPPVQDAPGETQENALPDQRQNTDTPVGPEGGQDIPEPTPNRNNLPEQVPEDLPPVTGEAPEDVLSPKPVHHLEWRVAGLCQARYGLHSGPGGWLLVCARSRRCQFLGVAGSGNPTNLPG